MPNNPAEPFHLQVRAARRAAHWSQSELAAKAGCPAMSTYVKIAYKPEGDVLTIDKKVTKHHQK